jgi:RimJ/RimL family protein N-acetyltransferase
VNSPASFHGECPPPHPYRYAEDKSHMNVIAETERLFIVNFEIDDTALLYQLTGNADVMKFFPKVLNYHETNEMLCTILEQYKRYGYCFWKLQLRTNGQFIGIAGLLHQDIEGKEETEIAYRIVREHWNKGYATEAAQACREYAQNVLRKERLISLILPKNISSIRVAQKLGAQKEKSVLFKGEEHDVYVY